MSNSHDRKSTRHTGPGPDDRRDIALECRSLQVTYNSATVAIDGVSVRVRSREIVTILGSNGAGKTTTLRGIGGFLASEPGAVTGGEVLLFGEPQSGRKPHQIARSGLLSVPERDKIFHTLTVTENLAAVSTLPGGDRELMRDFIRELFPPLNRLGRRMGGLLSGGERQMLAISKALIADPKVLMVDELSLGLAPSLVSTMLASLERIRAMRGISILMVEQNAAAALSISDHAYILQNGRVALEGDSEYLVNNADVQRLYLGGGTDYERPVYGMNARRRQYY
jgi:branched-chain amino acid transport system ATP-binding protein